MTKPIRKADGTFNGSIGDGKRKVPTPAPSNLQRNRRTQNLEPAHTFFVSRAVGELKVKDLLNELRLLREETKNFEQTVGLVDDVTNEDFDLTRRMVRAIDVAERELSENSSNKVQFVEPKGPVKIPKEAVLEDVAEVIMGLRGLLPNGYQLVNSEELFGDEHSSSRSAVIKDISTNRFYKFKFTYDYASGIPILASDWRMNANNDFVEGKAAIEVFPNTITSVEYKPKPTSSN